MKRLFSFGVFFIIVCTGPHTANAAYMSPISDLFSTSNPGADAAHIITFTVRNAVPASGTIRITPEGAFFIPASFDFTDVDVAVSNGGPYVDRNLAASASGSADGVTVISGSTGSIIITLSSASGIAANSSVRIILGTNATFQQTGTVSPINPIVPASYRVRIDTENAGVHIDDAKAMVVVVSPVTLTAIVNDNAPQILNALPTGILPAGSNVIELSFQTNVTATCRYATSSGVAYGSMTHTFSSVGGQLFYSVVSGHVDNTTYSYFIRCRDTAGATAQTDYELTFALGVTPTNTSSDGNTPNIITAGPPSGSGGSGGVGEFAGGSASLFQSSITLSGRAPANSAVTILKDGKQQSSVQATASGAFAATITRLDRGTYTLVTFALDDKQRKTSRFSSTLTLNAGTNNTISNVLLSPTIAADGESVPIGENMHVAGFGVPDTIVNILLRDVPAPGKVGPPKEYTASTTQTGTWEYSIPAKDLKRGTYEIKVKTVTPEASSEYNAPAYVGVGQKPSAQADTGNRSDINKDGKVNLVDFSILLTHWNESDPNADINLDGTVNLADFSILLFNWTG